MNESGRDPESWIAHIMLAFGIVAPPAALYWLVAMQPNTMGGPIASPPGIWVAVSTVAVGVGLWLAGVIWMIRIVRGPSDERVRRRYRVR